MLQPTLDQRLALSIHNTSMITKKIENARKRCYQRAYGYDFNVVLINNRNKSEKFKISKLGPVHHVQVNVHIDIHTQNG